MEMKRRLVPFHPRKIPLDTKGQSVQSYIPSSQERVRAKVLGIAHNHDPVSRMTKIVDNKLPESLPPESLPELGAQRLSTGGLGRKRILKLYKSGDVTKSSIFLGQQCPDYPRITATPHRHPFLSQADTGPSANWSLIHVKKHMIRISCRL